VALPLGGDAAAVEAALHPELGQGPTDRAEARLCCADGELRLEFRAQDVVALRAAVNTWLRLAQVAARIMGQENG